MKALACMRGCELTFTCRVSSISRWLSFNSRVVLGLRGHPSMFWQRHILCTLSHFFQTRSVTVSTKIQDVHDADGCSNAKCKGTNATPYIPSFSRGLCFHSTLVYLGRATCILYCLSKRQYCAFKKHMPKRQTRQNDADRRAANDARILATMDDEEGSSTVQRHPYILCTLSHSNTFY